MNIPLKRASHAAPGPYLGFALQPVRLCYHLLTAPAGAKVSLEHLDDVAVHYPDGSLLLEQCKSATRQNPIRDSAPDLWKTIVHWLETCAAGEITPDKSAFHIYVVPQRSGKLARVIHDVRSADDVDKIDAAVQRLIGNLATSEASRSFMQRYLRFEKGLRVAVLSRSSIESRASDPVAALTTLVEATISSDRAADAIETAIGFAKEEADRLIREGKPAIIDRDAFKRRFHAFVQRINRPDVLASLTPKPPIQEVDAVLTVRPIYVRQLEIIEAKTSEKLRAISDFLRTSADKSKWAEDGLLFPASLDEWDDLLIKHHAAISGEIADTHGDKDAVVRGRISYRQCSRVEAALEGRAVPGHFVHGCLHALADDRRIGWHPDYLSILDRETA